MSEENLLSYKMISLYWPNNMGSSFLVKVVLISAASNTKEEDVVSAKRAKNTARTLQYISNVAAGRRSYEIIERERRRSRRCLI